MASVRDLMTSHDIFDNAILRHGFTAYSRDYELIVQSIIGPAEPGVYSYLFRACVEVHYRNSVTAYRFPLDDVFIDFANWEAAGSPDGYVWGTNWSEAYPGWTYVEDSKKAADWSTRLGADMHEVLIETNVFELSLVFHDLAVSRLPEDDNA